MITFIDTATTLAALVDQHPSLARELERRGLDYCCGGRRSLADSCAAAGLDPKATADELLATITSVEPAPWTSFGAAELIDHLLETHHRYLWDEMPRLSALVEKVAGVHGGRHPELADIRQCWDEIRADMEPHLMKEERVLFPMTRELAASHATAGGEAPAFHCGTLRNPISVMLSEHDRMGELLARMRRLTDGYQAPADGCASYTALFAALMQFEMDTHLHVHKENNVLFPLVVRLEAEAAAR